MKQTMEEASGCFKQYAWCLALESSPVDDATAESAAARTVGVPPLKCRTKEHVP
jgi:hypothetical protein